MTDEENTPKSEDKTLAMLAHVTPSLASLASVGILGWLVPLIIWLVKKDESEFVATEAKEALNLQLTLFVGMVVSLILTLVCIGWAMLLVFWLYGLVYGIIAGISAYEGKPYRYPMVIRLIQ